MAVVAAVGTAVDDGDPKMEVKASETSLYRPFINLKHLMQRKWGHIVFCLRFCVVGVFIPA